jgi:hypothetical protein
MGKVTMEGLLVIWLPLVVLAAIKALLPPA